ncbi:MAG: hypothetical protein J0M34_01220 [Alphaproteobacteria bacterium]|nr:hypothetical protein [Alphaproteobacteria bacterium]
MSHEDKEMRAMLASFEVMPPSYLAQKIIANATALPQQRGLAAILSGMMGQSNAAFAYKGMALAAMLLLGVMTAQNQSNPYAKPTTTDMSGFVMAQGWMEE